MRKILSSVAIMLLLTPAFAFASLIYEQPVHSTSITFPSVHYLFKNCFAAVSTGNLNGVRIYTDAAVDTAFTGWVINIYGSNSPCASFGFDSLLGSTAIGAVSIGSQFIDTSAANANMTGWSYFEVEIYDQGLSHAGSNDMMGTTGLPTGPAGINTNPFIQVYDTPVDPDADTTTRIITTTPVGNSTIATSSTATIGATGYINPNDFQSGMFIQMQYALYSNFQASVANPSSLFTTVNFPISSSGAFTVSTTTSILRSGQYTLLTQIRTPSLLNNVINFFGFSQFATFGIQTGTSTKFYAVAPNGYDIFVASTTNSINSYIASSSISLASCSSWTSFSLGDCLNLLFVPQVAPIKDALDSFKNGFLSYAPWGYITRFAIIMSGSATTTLPSISVNIPLGDPHNATYSNGTFTLNTMDMLQGGDDLLNTVHTSFGADLTFQEATEPFVKLSIALALMMYIVHDLLVMRGGHSRKVVGRLH